MGLALALFWNWQARHSLHRVCQITGPHDASYGDPRTPRQELDTICSNFGDDDPQAE